MDISFQKTLTALPPEWQQDLLPAIQSELSRSNSSIVVLDDDPTGTQTVYDTPVLTCWSVEYLKKEFENKTSLFYILTNSRSLPNPKAKNLAVEIGKNLRQASIQTGRSFIIISRSDSTLRGHFPAEVDAIAEAIGEKEAIRVIIPFFLEGGRYTIDDIHYVSEGEKLVPVGDTPFAEDAAFGYASSNLRQWVEEKTESRVSAESVISISLEDIRKGGPEQVAKKLERCKKKCVCIVNAVSYRDVEVVVLGLLTAEKKGCRFLYRTAASFVRVRAGLPARSLLSAEQLNLPKNGGGLSVVGSYVPKSSQQLSHLLKNIQIESIEVRTTEILSNAKRMEEIKQIVSKIEKGLTNGLDMVLYTSRELVKGRNSEKSLEIGNQISNSLVQIIKDISVTPRYLLVKGGITSSDIATKGLGVKCAKVLGQIIPGVPVWQIGEESDFSGLVYIIFPGNVGGIDALTEIVGKLKRDS